MRKIRNSFILAFMAAVVLFAGCNSNGNPGGGNTEPIKYLVQYSSAHGTVPAAVEVEEDSYITEAMLPSLSEEGFVFKGWFINSVKIEPGVYKVTSNITLTAVWESTFKIYYSSAFGTVPETVQGVVYNSALTEGMLSALSDGLHEFEGWYIGETLATTEYLVTQDLTLTAAWKKVTVSFVTEKGEAAPITIYKGDEIHAAELPVLTAGGFSFEGWYADEEATEKITLDFAPDSDTVLYAKWTPVTYTLFYDANCEDASGSMASKTIEYEQTVTLTQNAFTRTGYTFEGWNTKADGTGTAYEDKAELTCDGEDVVLYAQWKGKQYKVTFYSNYGTSTTYTHYFTYGTPEKLPACTFVREGYRFVKWTTSSSGSGTSYADEEVYSTGTSNTVKLYAQWVEADRYLIKYENTKSATNSNPDSYRATEGATLTSLSKTGYDFVGWFDAADENGNGTGNEVTSWGANEKEGDITLYAKWTGKSGIKYVVKHYKQNANDDLYATTPTSETMSGTTDELTEAAAKDWDHFIAQEFEQVPVAPDGTTVVSIYYNRAIETMVFNTLGGTEIESITGKYGSTYTKPATSSSAAGAPVKTGYTFAGWTPTLPSTLTGGEYTAKWTAKSGIAYKVEHYQQNANDNEYTLIATDNKTGTTDADTRAAAKTTYTHFSALPFEQEKVAPDGSTVVKIYYNREIITFTFDLVGGTGAETVTGKYGQTVTVTNPTAADCTFTGWTPSLPETFATDKSFTANWTKEVTITATLAAESDISISKSVSENIVTLTAPEGYSGFIWKVDGVKQSVTSNQLTLDTTGWVTGTYYVTVFATKNSIKQSAQIEIVIE